MTQGEDIQNRLNGFAGQVMALCDGLPRTFADKHIGEQLFRSGTACAANDAEARRAEIRNDFMHKSGFVRKELNETLVWAMENSFVDHEKLPQEWIISAA